MRMPCFLKLGLIKKVPLTGCHPLGKASRGLDYQECHISKNITSTSLGKVHQHKKAQVEENGMFESFYLKRVQEGFRAEVISKKGFIG